MAVRTDLSADSRNVIQHVIALDGSDGRDGQIHVFIDPALRRIAEAALTARLAIDATAADFVSNGPTIFIDIHDAPLSELNVAYLTYPTKSAGTELAEV